MRIAVAGPLGGSGKNIDSFRSVPSGWGGPRSFSGSKNGEAVADARNI